MENASKALTIAGGMMIAIAVVGLLIFGFQKLRSYQSTQDESVKTQQVAEFNNQLEAYNKQVVPGYQMLSLAHYVIDLNKRSEDEKFDKIELDVNIKEASLGPYSRSAFFGKKFIDEFVIEAYDGDLLSSDEKKIFKEKYFKCTNVSTNNVNGRINSMSFDEITRK